MRVFWRALYIVPVVLCVAMLFSMRHASATINREINFQGKLTNLDGTNVADTSRTVVFSIYSVSSGGSAIWTESKSVATVDGIFQTALGDTTPMPGSLDFNSNSLYLGIKVATDAEMTPRVQLTAAPYAFNSDTVDGLDSTNFAQLAQGLQVDSSTTNASLGINKTGATANIFTFQRGGADVLTLGNTGDLLLQSQTDSASALLIRRAANADTVLSVDTTARSASGGNLVKIGNSTGTDTALTILKVDSATADPTSNLAALNGGIFYHSVNNKLSFIENGVVKVACNATDLACATLQQAYTSSSSPATILLSDAKNFVINSPDTATDPNIVFNLQCVTCSASGGKFTVQDGGNDVVTVNPSGNVVIAPTVGQSLVTNLAAGSQASFAASAVPTADLVNITNTGFPTTTAGVNGLQITYVGGAGAVEASAERIDLTPGGTAAGIWNGVRIVANPTGAVASVTLNGIKLAGPTSPGAGTEVGLLIDANWDAGLQLGSKTSDPAAPAADNIYVYSRKIAGRSLLRQKGASGVSFAYQPAIFEQNISYEGPSTGAAVTSFGSGWTIDTTASHVAATEAFGYSTNFATAAVAADTAGVTQPANQWFRGSTPGANGFFYVGRMALPDASYGAGATGTRIFIGLSSQTTATMTNSDNPAGDYAGFQYSTNRGDANWQFMTKNNVTQNIINTTLPATVQKMYDFYVYVAPQGTTVFWRVDNLTDGTTQEGSTATNLPTAATAMRAGAGIQTLTTTARNIRISKQYVEADK